MPLQRRPRRVVTPDGIEWQVGRRWLTRELTWRWRQRGRIASEAVLSSGLQVPSADGQGLLILVTLVVAVLLLIPVLFFGFELIIVGALLAAGVVARTVFRAPWVIEASSRDALTPGRHLEWRVRGWRKSAELIERVVSDLEAGREPLDRQLPE